MTSLNAYVRATHNAEQQDSRKNSQQLPAVGSLAAQGGFSQNGSWLSRILNNDDFQSSPMSLELPVRRSYTPLRPSAAAMTHRVTASLSQSNNNNNNNDAASPLQQLKEPNDTTSAYEKSASAAAARRSPTNSQRSGVLPTSLMMHTNTMSSARSATSNNPRPIPDDELASPLRDIERVADAAPIVYDQPPAANDPFIKHEHAVMDEIRTLRRSPIEYAKIVERELLLTRPFLPAAHEHLNLAGMKKFVDDRTQQLSNLNQQLAQLDEKHKNEVQALRDQWYADDNDRSKKRKNPAAQPGMKKADAEKALQQLLQDQEDQRREQIESMDRATEELRYEMQQKVAVVTVELNEANDGVEWLTKLISRLLTTRPLIPAESNRGLSIAARTVADESGRNKLRPYASLSGSLVEVEKTLPEVCSRFGEPSGGYLGIAALIGPPRSARETVFEMLLSLADRKFRRSRHALLDPRSAMIGCAWRKKVGDPVVHCNSVTVVVTCSHFSELAVVNERSHLNVDVLRREVNAACTVMNASAYDAYTQQPPEITDCPLSPHLATKVLHITRHIPEDPEGLMVSSDVEIVSPKYQPAECGNEAKIVLKCGPNAAVCAIVLKDQQQQQQQEQQQSMKSSTNSRARKMSSSSSSLTKSSVPQTMSSAPEFSPGEQLVQRDPSNANLLNIRIKLPGPGLHNVAIFLRDGSDLFRRIAIVSFNNQYQYDPREAWRRFPILSSDFADRNGHLIEPLDGVLAPDSEVVFKVSLPISAHYKGREKQRIAKLIGDAKKQDDSAQNAIERLQEKLEEARSSYEEANASRDASVSGIQAEMSVHQKDLQKRKSGKEHDRLKALVADAEAKIAKIARAIETKKAACDTLEEELQGYHKTRQQTAAMLVRYAEEQKILEKCTDRSKPLLVELATDERRATLAPIEEGSEVYAARIRTPGVGGHVSLFVGGALAVLFDVLPPPPHYLTSHTSKPVKLEM